MQTIAIVNRKGGTGKTATAQNMGAWLKKQGRTVLFVDMDSQANLTYAMGGKYGPGTMELLEGDADPEELIQDTPQGSLIVGGERLATADKIIDGVGKEYRLKEALEGLNYDYAIIDTPAALGTLTVNAMTAADKIIIPVQADAFSMQGVGMLEKSIKAVKKFCNNALEVSGILLTRYDKRANISRDMQGNLQKMADRINTKLFETPIRECISIKEAQSCKIDIFSYAPRSNAAKDYDAFMQEFFK